MELKLTEQPTSIIFKDSTAMQRYGGPLLTVHGCALMERRTEDDFIYTAVNLKTNRAKRLCRRSDALTTSGLDAVVEKLRRCPVAQVNPLHVDMPPGESLSHTKLQAILYRIFSEILPTHGFVHRQAQTDLAAHILEAVRLRNISLAEAEVGTGKTHAYLIAAALAKRARVNDSWLRRIWPKQDYAGSAHMPVVVSTSSIALQNAIVRDYIPAISRILLEHGVITTPLTAVIRKGREHYLCEQRLRAFYEDADEFTRDTLQPLLYDTTVDLADAPGITAYIKRHIGVPGHCADHCPHRERCRYLCHMARVRSGTHDFQVCNHGYLLADALRRRDGLTPLIPHYQAVIIDEGHKFLDAARQMYGVELGSDAIPRITSAIREIHFFGDVWPLIWRKARKLYGQHKELFTLLRIPDSEERDKISTDLSGGAGRHLHNIHAIAEQLLELLDAAEPVPEHRARYQQVQRELAALRDQAKPLKQHPELICWLERELAADRTVLRAIPRELDKRLHRDSWSRGVPMVLTSGTLSAGSGFSRIKSTLGLNHLPQGKVMETSKPSPFCYRENVLFYISESMPFPDNRDSRYLSAVAAETERLIRAAHGHAAVLFTSYKAMDLVWDRLSHQGLPFPFFRLDRGSTAAIDGFRQSGGGVLFASGAMWEGIDIPGDALSLLILVRLPFPAPDPIGEYERARLGGMAAYKQLVILPDTLVRLRQGFGRLIRLESDTGVFALLDCRVRMGGPYREHFLAALPRCRVTGSIAEVSAFLREKKSAEYFTTMGGYPDGIYGKSECTGKPAGAGHHLPGGENRRDAVPRHQRVHRGEGAGARTGAAGRAPCAGRDGRQGEKDAAKLLTRGQRALQSGG